MAVAGNSGPVTAICLGDLYAGGGLGNGSHTRSVGGIKHPEAGQAGARGGKIGRETLRVIHRRGIDEDADAGLCRLIPGVGNRETKSQFRGLVNLGRAKADDQCVVAIEQRQRAAGLFPQVAERATVAALAASSRQANQSATGVLRSTRTGAGLRGVWD